MNIILYPKNEKQFDNNGIGILSDAIDAEVYEVLNGQFELTVKYPIDGIHFADIAKGTIITAKPNPVSDPQPFDIYRITKPTNGTVTVYARHVAYRNRKITVSPFTAKSAPAALQGFKNNAVNDCPFEFWTDKSTAGDFKVKVPSAIWTLLGNSKGSILDTYGGEYEFDRWTVKLHNRRGTDRGVSIRYGKNLTSLEQDENCANVFTGVYPYWADLDGNVIMLPEKVVMTADAYEDELIMPLDLSQAFDTAPTEEQLRAKTESYIKANDIGKPDVSWTVEFVQLEQTEEYKGKALLERVLLGDTVSVVFPKLGVDVSARAVAARYLPLLGRYKNITLGKVRANIADTIVQQGQETAKKPSLSLVQHVSMYLAAAFMGAKGGAARLIDTDGDGMPDELYLADNKDPALAVRVWRFNYQGWAASKTGYNGPFTMGATINDGILADFITAGTLDATLVKVINLIADHLISISGSSKLEIDGAMIRLLSNTIETIRFSNEFEGLPIIYMHDVNDDFEKHSAEYTPHSIKLGGTSLAPVFQFSASGSVPKLKLNDGLGSMALSWKSNGDGTYTLIGS